MATLTRNRRVIIDPVTTGLVDPDPEMVETPAPGAVALVEQTENPDRMNVENGPEFQGAETIEDPLEHTIHPGPAKDKWTRFKRWIGNVAHDPLILVDWVAALIYLAREFYRKRVKRALTPDEAFMERERQNRRKQASLLASEADLYLDRMGKALDRHGFKYRPTKDVSGGGSRITRHVVFDRIGLETSALYLHIDTNKLPTGVSIMQLMDHDLLVDLSISCGRKVSAEFSDKFGANYIIERAVGVRGIPMHVQFLDMLNSFPESADGLTIPIGMTTNSKPIYRSLGRMYSMLVAGTIGGGKSNFLSVALITLIRRNSPDRLKLVLVDLKGGLEFQFFEGIPHLLPIPEVAPNGIANVNDQVPGVLIYLHKLGEQRMATMRKAGEKNIGRYNAKMRSHRMPHVLLVIDEWADVMFNKTIKSECEETLANIAQRFRAVGIHVIVCTQIPKAEVISTRIKGVLPAKLAFSVPSNPASLIILDNGSAKGLSPAGRAIFQWDKEMEIQTPFINEEIITKQVEAVKTGNYAEADSGQQHDVTPSEIMDWALKNKNGYLSWRDIFAEFSPRKLTRAELLSWLSSWENQTFVIGTTLYKVDPSEGSRGRLLKPVTETTDASDKKLNDKNDQNIE